MRVLINVTGHGYVADSALPQLEAGLEALRVAAAGVGMNLRCDLQLTEPDPVPPPPPEGSTDPQRVARAAAAKPTP